MNQQPQTSAPTPDEVRWAAGMMNARRYGRPATDADLAAASDIMSRQRKAHGQRRKASAARLAEALGAQDARQGAVAPRPATVADAPPAAPPAAPSSPLVVARAAVAAGITEMVAEPAPKPKRKRPVVEAVYDLDPDGPDGLLGEAVPVDPTPEPAPDPEATPAAYPVPTAEEAFRDASARLLSQTQTERGRFQQARDQAARLVAQYEGYLDRLARREEAIQDGLRALDAPDG